MTDGSHFSPKEMPNGKQIIATVKDMQENGFDFTEAKRISDDDFRRLAKDGCSPMNGDILISKDGANCLDLIFVYNQSEQIVLLSSIAIVRLKKGFDPFFYRYYLLSPLAQELMKNGFVTGSAIPRVILKNFKKIPVPVPPNYEIQNTIAKILWSVDSKIELNKKMNRTLESIGAALFKLWFVDFEFPNQEGKSYKTTGGKIQSTQYGEIPEDWEIKRLGDITDVIFSGGTPNTQNKAYWSGDFPWLSSGETSNHFIIKTNETITKSGIDNSSTRLAKAGDIVIASAGQGKTRGQTSLCFLDTYINQSIIAIRAKSNLTTSSFLYFDLARRYNQLRGLSDSNSIRGSLTTRTFKDLEIIKPPFQLVTEFDSAMKPLLEKIKINLLQNETLTKSRDLLLPKLISGKIIVPINGANVEAPSCQK